MSPLSRRSFMTSAIGAGAGAVALSPQAAAAHESGRRPGSAGALAGTIGTVEADPVAYLANITVLADFPIRIDLDTTWAQGVSINEADGEIYIANQRTGGTYLRIDVRQLDGTYVSSRTIPIAAGAYTEALPWFRSPSGDLCFIIRTQTVASYAIYNYTADVLGAPIAILGRAKADVDGPHFVTSDVWLNDISRFHVYDWASVKAGTPTLLHTVVLDSAQPLFEKSQGIAANGGHFFVLQGAADGTPSITAFNAAGRTVTALAFDRAGFAEALNLQSPGLVTDPASYRYENEGGCTYQGKLVTLEVINNHPTDNYQARCVLVVHNEVEGSRIQTVFPEASHDTGWQPLTLRSGISTYATDTVPRWRRIGNHVYLNGAVKGISGAPSSTPIADIPVLARPDRNLQAVAPASGGATANWQASSSGTLHLLNTTVASPGASTWYPFSVQYVVG